MRKWQRVVLWSAVAVVFVAASLGTVYTFGVFQTSVHKAASPVPPGDQEIAWIAPATSSEAWERLVEAARQLERDWGSTHPDWPPLEANVAGSFPPLSVEVPEFSLRLGGEGQPRLWLRWYKIHSEMGEEAWVRALTERSPPPLAIVGGDTTYRAERIGTALSKVAQKRNQGSAGMPLFLITTATAEVYAKDERDKDKFFDDKISLPKLMQIYPQRSFRFSFTNPLMTGCVLEFLRQRPELCPMTRGEATAVACAKMLGEGPNWSMVGSLVQMEAARRHRQSLFLLSWRDDSYSLDLAKLFENRFRETIPRAHYDYQLVAYSTGGMQTANPREALSVNTYLPKVKPDTTRLFVVLPTGTQRVRRVVRQLVGSAPDLAARMVVLSGDSITLNHVYRDREILWSVVDVPVELVFFRHRNPIDRAAGFRERPRKNAPWEATGTDDLLLYRDVVEALVLSCHDQGKLLSNADVVLPQLQALRWRDGVRRAHDGLHLFDKHGNRCEGTGEHVVWLEPNKTEDQRPLPSAELHVFARRALADGRFEWREAQGAPLLVNYHVGAQPADDEP